MYGGNSYCCVPLVWCFEIIMKLTLLRRWFLLRLMNRDGLEYQSSEAFEYKVTDHITHADMCIIGNEVGGNFSQKSDDHIGGTVYIYERNFTPQTKTSNKENRSTLMRLTTL